MFSAKQAREASGIHETEEIDLIENKIKKACSEGKFEIMHVLIHKSSRSIEYIIDTLEFNGYNIKDRTIDKYITINWSKE